MSDRTCTTIARHRRRGSIYPAVLAYSSLITIIGLSALLALRLQRRASEGEIAFSQARLHARSAIGLGMWAIKNDSNWRSDLSNALWVKDRPIGTGTYTLEVFDPNDADLANSAFHPVVLTGTGMEGPARHKTQVRLEPVTKPLGCLEVSLHAGEDLLFDTAVLKSDQIISANDTVDSVNSTIDADVEAVKRINGDGYARETSINIDRRSMPTSAVFDYYLARGTPIAILSLPSNANGARMDKMGLSPASNPFGAETNAEGIYVIDCQGINLDIKSSRIVGTLVLKNPGPDSIIRQSMNWEPAIANYPALMVSGNITISLDAADLSEAAIGANFNPPGTPYDGEEDIVLDDTYSSLIKGLIYVSGNLIASSSNTFEGIVVVGGTLSATGTMDLTYKTASFDDPPPGFIEVDRMQIVAGSWQQVVD